MTKPTVTMQISLGNIITVLVFLGAVAASWFTTQYRSESAALAASDNASEISEMKDRIRTLETRSARDSEQLNTLRRDIGELKTGQREINSLLRQLLQRGSIDPR